MTCKLARITVALCILTLTCAGHAYEEALPRYALIVGNADYELAPLTNPVNDARDMAAKLEKLRYRVTLALNQNPEQLRETVADFYFSIEEENAVSLFYYAGHAVQLENSNFLIPVGKNFSSVSDIQKQAYPLNELLRELRDAYSEQNIIILDACRNNPFEYNRSEESSRGLKRVPHNGDGTASGLGNLNRGLAPMEAPPGTLVAYATEPGNVAADGAGRNGTYTRALLKHIDKAETAEALFKKVRREVLRSTDKAQIPWEHSSLLETFYFAPPKNQGIPNIVSF